MDLNQVLPVIEGFYVPMIQFQGSAYLLDDGENLLDGLLRQNARVPHSCRAGVCHSCLLRTTTGTTLLACQTTVTTPLCLTLPCRNEAPGIITAITPHTTTEVTVEIATRLPLAITVGETVTLVSGNGLEGSFALITCDESRQTFTCNVTRIAGGSAFSAWVHADAAVGDRLMVVKMR